MIRMEVWGPLAVFSDPAFKVERMSYPVITPSAARGMLEAVFFHPGMKYKIRCIYVCSPIQYTNIRRNEVSSIIVRDAVLRAYKGANNPLYLNTSKDIQQRATMALKDVHYVIESEFEITEEANSSDNDGKFQDMLKRRLRRGQAFHTPYFGCREFPAYFRLWEGGKIPTIPETRDLGYMLYDMDYSDLENIVPMFFHARMVNGVIDVGNCEVVR